MIRRAPRTEATGWQGDERLSWSSRGLLGFILAQPDNYRVTREELADKGPDGLTVVRRCLKELADAGYLLRDRWQDEKGHWRTETVVYETCENLPPKVDDRPSVHRPAANQPVEALGLQVNVSQNPSRAETARELVSEWWEPQDPKPGQRFMGVVNVVDDLLAKGYPPDLLRQALTEVPVMSGPAFDFWRNSRNGKGRRQTHNDRNQATFQRAIDRIEREEARGQASSSDGLGPVAGELGTH